MSSELWLAVDVAERLVTKGLKIRIVSFPSQRLFEKQPIHYKRETLQRQERPAVVIEAYTANGWERYADATFYMKTERIGQSLPPMEAFGYIGSTPENIEKKKGIGSNR